jgi:membrane fusion protein (multidrug efflux system)
MRPQIDPVDGPPNGVGRDARDGHQDQPAANRPGAVRAMNPFVLFVRRLVMTLLLLAALSIGAVAGLAKMGVDLPAPLSTPKVNSYVDYVGAHAEKLKAYITRKFGSYFQKHEEEHQSESHKIVATTPKVQDIILTESFVCQIRSQRHIEVRALEGGYLEKILVREGQSVTGPHDGRPGDLLFKILPTLYEAKLEAEKAEADLATLKYQYTDSLAQKNVVSPKEVALANAERKRAQAKADLAKAERDFTYVTAPFDGIIDRLHQREGSLIKEGDILTTLADNSVMWVYFNVPEKYYLEYMAHRKQHEQEDKIELMLANGDTFPYPGRIEPSKGHGAIEADFNNETGNIKFRADFQNPRDAAGYRLLRHGQTGTIKIHRPMKDALLIPQRATFELLDKRYVWVIGEDDLAHQRLITIKHELEDVFVVNSGLDAKDKIVLEGVREVEEGGKVEYEARQPEVALDKKNQKFHAE